MISGIFADYSAPTQSSRPFPADPDARIETYWESSHYTKQLGSNVLDRVLLNKTIKFGEKLSSENIESWLQEIESRRQSYRTREAEALEELRAFLYSDGTLASLSKKFD